MKRLIIVSLTALVMLSCESHEEKMRNHIEQMYANPLLKDYYGEERVKIWRGLYEESKGREVALEIHEEFIINKLVDAEADRAIQEALSK